jgi:hypothetical protein
MTLWLNCGRRRPWLPAFGINRDAMLHSCNTAGPGLLAPCKLRCKKAVEWNSTQGGCGFFCQPDLWAYALQNGRQGDGRNESGNG